MFFPKQLCNSIDADINYYLILIFALIHAYLLEEQFAKFHPDPI